MELLDKLQLTTLTQKTDITSKCVFYPKYDIVCFYSIMALYEDTKVFMFLTYHIHNRYVKNRGIHTVLNYSIYIYLDPEELVF